MAVALDAPLPTTQDPQFSVIITCYNQASFIRDAIDSALSQVNPEGLTKEVIVVDDGSGDGSAAAISHYETAVRVVTNLENTGAIGARNCAAQIARGHYLVFLDGDDALMPDALRLYAQLIIARRPKILVGRWIWFEGSVPAVASVVSESQVEFVWYDCLIQKDRPFGLSASTFVVERNAFEHVGGWSEGTFPGLDVVDLATKLGCCGGTILIRSPATVHYRLHPGNTIHDVGSFLDVSHLVVAKESAGEYPGGQSHRFQRRAWLGGVIGYWVVKGMRAGLYRKSLSAALSAGSMIGSAIVRRLCALLMGRRPVETLAIPRPTGAATSAQSAGGPHA